MTTAGLAVGSTAYMAPEQARGEDVDGRADLYSMGVLLWEMLTGRLPFEASDALSMAVMHAQDPIPKVPQHLRHWQRFMNRALSKQAANRFQDAAQMADAIRAVQQRKPWSPAIDALQRFRPSQRWAKPVWATLGVTAVTLVVLAFSLGRDEEARPQPQSATIATAPDATPAVDPTSAMLQPLPEAPLQRALGDAREQIARGRLTEPEDANAFDSVLLAWHTDSTHPDVAKAIDELTIALSGQVVRSIKEGRDDRARDLAARAVALGQQTSTANAKPQKDLRDQAGKALDARLQVAVRRRDGADAQRVAELAQALQLPRKLDARLIAQAKSLPKGLARGATIDTASQSIAKVSVALTPRPVSRREYSRFAAANGRDASLCRERASLLRVLDPRNWQSPGFRQDENDPVVCISLDDAQAYAQWYSAQTGRRYRLPSAEEVAQKAADVDGRAVSMWLRDCGRNCQQRQVAGESWRSKEGQRTLLASRGYDDVGFRLVRER